MALLPTPVFFPPVLLHQKMKPRDQQSIYFLSTLTLLLAFSAVLSLLRSKIGHGPLLLQFFVRKMTLQLHPPMIFFAHFTTQVPRLPSSHHPLSSSAKFIPRARRKRRPTILSSHQHVRPRQTARPTAAGRGRFQGVPARDSMYRRLLRVPGHRPRHLAVRRQRQSARGRAQSDGAVCRAASPADSPPTTFAGGRCSHRGPSPRALSAPQRRSPHATQAVCASRARSPEADRIQPASSAQARVCRNRGFPEESAHCVSVDVKNTSPWRHQAHG